MEALLQRIPLFVILYAGWLYYEAWNNFEIKKEEVSNRLPAIRQKINKARREKEQVKNYLQDIEAAKKNIELVAAEVESLQRKLPETIQDAENLGLIKSLAESLNIKNIYLSPGIEENKGFYYTKSYKLSASATYLQLLIFFEKIEQSERLLNIESVDIVESKEKQRGRFYLVNVTVMIKAYRYNPHHKEDRGIEKIEKNFKKGTKA